MAQRFANRRRVNDEVMQARMLKPSMERLDFQDSNSVSSDSVNSNLNSGLDLNAPLLSVRRLRDREEQPGDEEQANAPALSRKRSSKPFFAWEQQPLIRTSQSNGNSDLAPLPLLQPPPASRFSPVPVTTKSSRLQQQQQLLQGDEARSEATFSVAETCFVSVMSDCSGRSSGSTDKGGDLDDHCHQLTATTDAAAARDTILMQRFLPAAKALATAASSSSPMKFGGGMKALSDDRRIIKLDASPPAKQPRTRFEDLILRDEEETRANEVMVEELDQAEGEGGGVDRCGPSAIGICGLLPDLLATFFHSTARQREEQPRFSTWKKLQPVEMPRVRHRLMDMVKVDEDSEDEEDIHNLRLHRASRYTPSRGNLLASSPMVAGNNGFLGMPRKGITYPAQDTAAATEASTKTTSMSTSLDQLCSDDVESVSSVSLASLKLDNSKVSSGQPQRRSNSGSGASEKVFCLDTLNQAREAEAARATAGSKTMAQYLSVKETVQPAARARRPQLGDLMVIDRPNASSLLRVQASAVKAMHQRQTFDKSSVSQDGELRICWHHQ